MGLKYEKVHEWSGEEEIAKVSLNSIPKRRRTLFFWGKCFPPTYMYLL